MSSQNSTITEQDLEFLRVAEQRLTEFKNIIKERYLQFCTLTGAAPTGNTALRVDSPTKTVVTTSADGDEVPCYVLEEFFDGFRSAPKKRYVPTSFVHEPATYSAEYQKAQKVLNRFSGLTAAR